LNGEKELWRVAKPRGSFVSRHGFRFAKSTIRWQAQINLELRDGSEFNARIDELGRRHANGYRSMIRNRAKTIKSSIGRNRSAVSPMCSDARYPQSVSRRTISVIFPDSR
jgi:hypothetical protein